MQIAPRIAAFVSGLVIAFAATAEDSPSGATLRIGGDIQVSEPTDGPLNALGGRITVDAHVAGPLRIAGGNVDIDSNAAVDGDVAIAGGHLTVRGPIQGSLKAAGGQVILDGPISGNASVAAGSLTLGPDARIAGTLRFHGGELRQDPGAQVAGGITHEERRSHRHEATFGEKFSSGWFWTAGLIVLAAILAGALPGPSQRLGQELRERPWMAPLLGFLALTAIPVAAVLVMITIIGIPIGLMALALYAVLLLVGYVWLAVVLGGLLLDRFKPEVAAETAWRIGAAMLTMIAIALLVRIPFLGGLFKFAVLVVGVGMIVGAVMRRVNRAAPPAAPSAPATPA